MVVRLKGGDPFVFGRGGEEALALGPPGSPTRSSPGVSSASACPAYGGVPLTHRGVAASFTVVTGHAARRRAAGRRRLGGARPLGGTLVVLMGGAHRGEIAARLDRGRSRCRRRPVARRRARHDAPQRTVAHHARRPRRRSRSSPPATIVIGEVAALDLAWFEDRPLFGWRGRRHPRPAAGLDAGRPRSPQPAPSPIELPDIAIADAADGGAALARARRPARRSTGSCSPRRTRSSASCGTLRDARALGRRQGRGDRRRRPPRRSPSAGIVADLVPGALRRRGARSRPSRDAGPAGAVRACCCRAPPGRGTSWPRVCAAWAGRSRSSRPTGRCRPRRRAASSPGARRRDAVTFTSSSAVRVPRARRAASRCRRVVACIGPITADATGRGVEAGVEARRRGRRPAQHSSTALVDALATRDWPTTARPREPAPAGRDLVGSGPRERSPLAACAGCGARRRSAACRRDDALRSTTSSPRCSSARGSTSPAPIASMPGVVQHTVALARRRGQAPRRPRHPGARALRRARAARTPSGRAPPTPTGSCQVALRALRDALGDELVLVSPTSASTSTPTTATAASSTPRGEVDNDATLERYARGRRRPGRGGRRPRRAERDDGRPGGGDPQRARRRGPRARSGSSPTRPSTPRRFYGPFRDAVDVTIAGGGDRRGYQQDPAQRPRGARRGRASTSPRAPTS